MSLIKRHLEQLLDPAEAASQELLQSMDSALALEAMSSFLKNAQGKLGPTALRLANVAIEAYSVKIPAMRDLPLAFALEEGADPDVTVAQGLKAVQDQIQTAWAKVDEGITRMMLSQVVKMAAYKDRAQALRASVTELTNAVNRIEPNQVPDGSEVEASSSFYELINSERGFTPCAADVSPALLNLMSTHAQAWTKVVAERVQWLSNHKAMLMDNKDVFGDLTFDGQELLILGAQPLATQMAAEAKAHATSELPGCYRAFILLPEKPGKGVNAVEAMRLVDLDIVRAKVSDQGIKFNAMTPGELKNFVVQLEALLPALSNWYKAVNTDMWSNTAYADLLCHAVMRGLEYDGPGQREFKNYAIAVFRLMYIATKDVDDYVFTVIEAMRDYANACLAKYQQKPQQ